jgi:NADP-dependent 3-hydroxy acid dehydrogenase YdfG
MQIFLLMQINGTVGYNMLKSMLEYTQEEIQTGMSANFESAFHTCQLAYPLLKASGNGSIVNVSSLSGTVACWPGALYGGMQGMVEVIIITCSHFLFLLYAFPPGDKWVFNEFLYRMEDGE